MMNRVGGGRTDEYVDFALAAQEKDDHNEAMLMMALALICELRGLRLALDRAIAPSLVIERSKR